MAKSMLWQQAEPFPFETALFPFALESPNQLASTLILCEAELTPYAQRPGCFFSALDIAK